MGIPVMGSPGFGGFLRASSPSCDWSASTRASPFAKILRPFGPAGRYPAQRRG